ncbi:phosphatidylinositol 3,4,5-trisphosphate 3-phosphatase TPTE2-like isoform X2 [Talpa occidentalis]|nr:phosphatidylinositol 3,4,5-trisphosphate 3-phosphatase TPTE2-like isoform X2 [Talpa occidentalis]XP_037383133.1 phosphatidylinositol 3,4,5-trisphosphate 3-phosphatase TPTE2-like isoform X2 [Talpa occidentalis]XP_037383134.1 phosphatidylinositol 3,4,5-trisphosphate 3-phosphatase TPTE2-like isoform X2 [Talpa occidentalis]XP_054557805.1 phosphatidylinositol 3,4,5-trisphosphate 3-phosphatase TPTE2-like isoform X2 [Talpa occidentalis]XP_054557806.1 phosphatidylinositol 3,4,5-trisphosphate 3-phosp
MKKLRKMSPSFLRLKANKVMDVSPPGSDFGDRKGADPRELTSVNNKEVVSESTALYEMTPSASGGHANVNTAWSEFTPSTTEGHSNANTTWSEVTAESSEGHSIPNTAWSDFTPSTSEGHNNANTAWSDFTPSASEGYSSANTEFSESTTGILGGGTNKTCDPHESENITCVEDTSKIIMDQLSRLDDGDEDVYIHSLHEGNIMKKIIHLIVASFTFRIFGILLIFLDVSLVITDLVTDNAMFSHLEYRLISLAIALFFLIDVLLRVYVDGMKPYFSDVLNSLDAGIIVVTLLVNIVYMFYDYRFLNDLPRRITILFRPLRFIILIRILHLANQKRQLEKVTRRMVSENKRRYKKDGFDLDLTYVTERIIAMSFPSSGRQSFYRNPIKEVARFLDTKHQNHYRVYNLCSERAYDPKFFHYNVHRILIDDHNVPTLSEMMAFSMEVEEWLTEDKENIVAIHCKGGKGRTGTMVCVCLITSGIFVTAQDSLFYFGERRTDKSSSAKFQGVETPSQNRYVGYFADVKNIYKMTLPPRKILKIKKFCLYAMRGIGKGNGSDLKVQVIMQQKIVFHCSAFKNCRIFHDIKKDRVIIKLLSCPPLYDDVKVQFLCSNLPKYYDNCPFFFWFHTSFIEDNRLYLSRNEVDNLHKPKAWKIYPPKFAIEIYFDDVQ